MRALVVYESMFGNTHEIAERIAAGLRPTHEVTVLPVGEAADGAVTRDVADVDLLVVGGPTHAHGMTRAMTRASARDVAEKEPDLALEPGFDGPGLREWLDQVPDGRHHAAAAFDTRIDAPAAFTGRASKGIAKRLERHGFELVMPPESFLVDKHNHLLDGEGDRAERWAARLAAGATLV